MLDRIQSADRAELARMYTEIVGYDPFADDPTLSDDEVASTLAGYVQLAGLSPQFVVDGAEPVTLADMLENNRDSPEVCEWLKTAQPGDVWRDVVSVECVA